MSRLSSKDAFDASNRDDMVDDIYHIMNDVHSDSDSEMARDSESDRGQNRDSGKKQDSNSETDSVIEARFQEVYARYLPNILKDDDILELSEKLAAIDRSRKSGEKPSEQDTHRCSQLLNAVLPSRCLGVFEHLIKGISTPNTMPEFPMVTYTLAERAILVDILIKVTLAQYTTGTLVIPEDYSEWKSQVVMLDMMMNRSAEGCVIL